mmetsp:Transcript_80723/g.250566  ORF Transcript_80723/g.250566 Transcript_80723/m.250566 type:complete len:469 (-) Transcript_80723:21-1427(-)
MAPSTLRRHGGRTLALAHPARRRCSSEVGLSSARPVVCAVHTGHDPAERRALAAGQAERRAVDLRAGCGAGLVAVRREPSAQDACPEQRVHHAIRHELCTSTIRVPRVQRLEQIHTRGEGVVGKERPRLVAEALSDSPVDFLDQRERLLVHVVRRDALVGIKRQDYHPHFRVAPVDEPDHAKQVRYGDGRRIHPRELRVVVAGVACNELLGVVDPARQHGDVTHARVNRYAREAERLRAVRGAAPSWPAAHGPAGDPAEAGRAALAALEGKAPAAPAGLADAGRLQRCVLGRVLALRDIQRPRQCLLCGRHLGQLEAQPPEEEVQLLQPGHPDSVAGTDGIDAESLPHVEGGALLVGVARWKLVQGVQRPAGAPPLGRRRRKCRALPGRQGERGQREGGQEQGGRRKGTPRDRSAVYRLWRPGRKEQRARLAGTPSGVLGHEARPLCADVWWGHGGHAVGRHVENHAP